MKLSFLPPDLRFALANLNMNLLSEIRLRKGQPVIIEYMGEYTYINPCGKTSSAQKAIKTENAEKVLSDAMENSVFAYSEQLKNGFITVDGGVRIGVAGEYVTENGKIKAVRSVTSLNIRIPHCIDGCAKEVYGYISRDGIFNTLVYSLPGYGKTTVLRDLAKSLGKSGKHNVLVFDERGEIAAMDGYGNGYNLGDRCDVIRCGDKLSTFENAIRAMKPDVIVTDELYGENDFKAVRYAMDCGIAVLASTHVTDIEQLKKMPFDCFVKLTGIGEKPIIYDKNFIAVYDNNTFDASGEPACRG